MPSAKVILREVDRSTRVASFPGVSGAIVIPARKGPVNEPILITNDDQLLSTYTPKETVEVGDSTAFFSALAFLEKSTSLYVVRPEATGVLYGSALIKTAASSTENATSPAGIADPTAHVFDGMPDVAGVAEVSDFDFVGQTGTGHDVVGAANHSLLSSALNATDYYFWFNVTDGANTQTDPAVASRTGIQVDILDADTDALIAGKVQAAIDALGDFGAAVVTTVVTVTNAATGDTTDASDVSTGAAITVTTQGVTEVDEVDEALFIYGANPGVWNDDVYITITDNTAVEPDSFVIDVFTSDNLVTPIEQYTASRIQGKKDGFNQNIFVEDVLQSSNYIRALSNPAIDENTLPKDQSTPLALGGGDDGAAVTDGEMITALDVFSNPDDIRITVLMDGGQASPAFSLAMDTLVTNRQDSVALHSVPFSDEASATYIADITDYRDNQLNLNSSYSALYTTHVKIFDKYNDRDIFVSPDGFAAASISFSSSNFEIWYPPAGFERGLVNALDVRRKFTEGERDALQDSGINPIRFAPGKGIAIWGQKTLLSRPSSLDRMNVRLLLVVLGPQIKEALETFLFRLNDEAEQSRAKAVIDTALSDFQSRRGITDFQSIVEGDTADPNAMKVKVFIVPTASIEKIPFDVIITRSATEFSLA